MQIILFEDHLIAELRPVILSRPAFAINMCGTNLYNLAKNKGKEISYIIRDYLKEITSREFPNQILKDKSLLFLNASLVPSVSILDEIFSKTKKGDAFLAQSDFRVAVAFFPNLKFNLTTQNERSITNFLRSQEYRLLEDHFPLINYPFDIIRYNPCYFEENLRYMKRNYRQVSPGVFVGKDVHIHPTVCLDSKEGTIVIENKATIGPLVYLKGPLYIGNNSKIIERTSIKEYSYISHTCKVGGEVESSIIESYSNKQHHGFLGHSYVGSWVNLGAGTSTSDLKNTYGDITVEYQGKKIPTGMQFLGCIIGDYSKTAINTSIFTGKIIGVSSYIYGFVTANVPSFSNYAKTFGQITEYYLDSAVRTQKRMFSRRGIKQEHLHIKLLEDIYETTRDERLMSTKELSL